MEQLIINIIEAAYTYYRTCFEKKSAERHGKSGRQKEDERLLWERKKERHPFSKLHLQMNQIASTLNKTKSLL